MTIPKGFKPQLAINIDDVKVQPAVRYASEKLDGIRVIFFEGVAYSRTLKPLPNKLLQKLALENADLLHCCDGEVIAGDLYAEDVLQRSTSFCMKADKVDDFKVYLFDRVDLADTEAPWLQRYCGMKEELERYDLPKEVCVLEHYFVRPTLPETDSVNHVAKLPWVTLDVFEQHVLSKGGEGVMVRDAYGKYKYGRSGTKTPEIQKVKRFMQEEFEVIGYNQLETNQNELQRDERGYAKRSTSKEGKELVDALGGLVLRLPDGKTFNAGSGFTYEQRLQFWSERDTLVGRQASIQFFGFSKDGFPLLPVFKAFRSELDM